MVGVCEALLYGYKAGLDLETMLSGAGAAIADYDGDELPDIFLTRMVGGHRLYRNLGDFRFEDVTASAGVVLADEAWGQGATFVDIDNDGDLDLYVCFHNGPNRLYINNSQGAFTEQAKSFGLDFAGASVMPAFADFDRDGRPDLLVGSVGGGPLRLFRNEFPDGAARVRLELIGTESNRSAIGARVELHVNGRRIVRDRFAANGRRQVESMFEMSRNAHNLIAIYEDGGLLSRS